MDNETVDFIAFAISHWHALGIDAFVCDLSKTRKRKLKGVIIILPHPKDGILIDELDFLCKNFAEVKFCFISSCEEKNILFRGINLIKRPFDILIGIKNVKNRKGGREIYILSVMKPNIDCLKIFKDKGIATKYLPIFFIIDEGIGSYFPKKIWNLVAKLDKQEMSEHFNFIKLIKNGIFYLEEIVNKFLEKRALNYISTKNGFLFAPEKDALKPRWSVINLYKKVLKKRKKTLKDLKNNISIAVILGQPFTEYGQVLLRNELKLMEDVITILIQRGLKVIIKPHPRENSNKYASILTNFKQTQVEIIKKNDPAEDFFLEANIKFVIGFTSTSLLNAAFLYNIPAISITKLLESEDELLNLSKNEFEKLTKDVKNIFHINSIEEIEHIMDSKGFKLSR